MRAIFSFICLIFLFGCAAHTKTSRLDRADGKHTVGQSIDDARISLGIHTDLAALDLYKPIDVKVTNGRVIYTGTVRSSKDSLLAVGVAWKQNGVHEVINDLKVDENSSGNTKQLAKDSWITTKLKTKILAEKGVKSSNYTIITTDGTVYLLGKTNSKNELNKVKNLAFETEGVKNVIDQVKVQ